MKCTWMQDKFPLTRDFLINSKNAMLTYIVSEILKQPPIDNIKYIKLSK